LDRLGVHGSYGKRQVFRFDVQLDTKMNERPMSTRMLAVVPMSETRIGVSHSFAKNVLACTAQLSSGGAAHVGILSAIPNSFVYGASR